MSNYKKVMMTAAGGGGILNVENVFSTDIWIGNGGNDRAITNNIDLSGEGGMVWLKNMDFAFDHLIGDTERGINKGMYSNSTAAENNFSDRIKSATSTGFTIGTADQINSSNTGYTGSPMKYCSWTFRQAPKFFDVVTYTGNGTAGRTIAHNLGCAVGMMAIKPTNATGSWIVYHRGVGATKYLEFNGDSGAITASWMFNNTEPTSSVFTLKDNVATNYSGREYVAYLWAHNDGDGDFGETGDQDIIKCGSYTGNGSDNGPSIDLGFEPQYLMIKKTDGSANWYMFDNMRGVATGYNRLDDAGLDSRLLANKADAQAYATNFIGFRSNGFELDNGNGDINANSYNYVYMAIRRGPMAVPENATDVFALDGSLSSSVYQPSFSSGFPVDFAISYSGGGQSSQFPRWSSRLTGNKYVKSSSSTAETSDTDIKLNYSDGWGNFHGNSPQYVSESHMFRRAPSFMDIVAYKGLGGNQGVQHNLGVTPEFIIIKNRNLGNNWVCKHTGIGLKELTLNGTGVQSVSDFWQSGDDADVFYTTSGNKNEVNNTSYEYIAYLFSSLDGIAKVGSYTGNGSGSGQNQTIDCGFSSTPRLIVIKNADQYYRWYYWDSINGINTGSEERNYWNYGVPDYAMDLIDPTSSGFTVNWNSHSDRSMNHNNKKYIYFAVA